MNVFPRQHQPWVQNAIFFSLTAMEMAWFTPLALAFLPDAWRTPPIIYLLGLWAVMLGMMAIAHFLEQREISSPTFELIVAGLLLALGSVAVRMFVFGHEPLFNLRWVAALVAGGRQTIKAGIILGTLAFLWWRAVTFLQRDITFFIIGYDFRKGVLALLVSVALFHSLSKRPASLFVYTFFFFGLMAVALGRAEDKARATGDGNAPIPQGWLRVVGISVLMVMVAAWLWARVWSLNGFRGLWRLLTPVLGWMAPYVERAMLAFLRMLNPLLEWLVGLARRAVGGKPGASVLDNLTKKLPSADKVMGQNEAAYAPPLWLSLLFHYIIPIAIALILLALLAFWLVKRRSKRRLILLAEEHVQVASLEGEGLMNALRQGMKKLKDLAGLVGAFGLGRGFYDAISIRHIYANLQRLAAKRGFPRDPTWTPNDYLPRLMQAFPGQEEDLRRITQLYNALEYGHIPADPHEIRRVRAAWERLRTTPAIDSSPSDHAADGTL